MRVQREIERGGREGEREGGEERGESERERGICNVVRSVSTGIIRHAQHLCPTCV